MWLRDDEGGDVLTDYKYLEIVNANSRGIAFCNSKGYIMRDDTQ